jgi:hypothetical protein
MEMRSVQNIQINEYVHNVPKQNLNTNQEYLYHAHRQNLKSGILVKIL